MKYLSIGRRTRAEVDKVVKNAKDRGIKINNKTKKRIYDLIYDRMERDAIDELTPNGKELSINDLFKVKFAESVSALAGSESRLTKIMRG